MTDPVTTAIAAALVAKAVDGLSDAGKAAFAALARLVRRKFADNQASRAVLARVEIQPGDQDARHALAEALQQMMIKDQAFAADLQRLWREVQDGNAAGVASPVVNLVSGDVAGTVVQAHDIHGGISFGRS